MVWTKRCRKSITWVDLVLYSQLDLVFSVSSTQTFDGVCFFFVPGDKRTFVCNLHLWYPLLHAVKLMEFGLFSKINGGKTKINAKKTWINGFFYYIWSKSLTEFFTLFFFFLQAFDMSDISKHRKNKLRWKKTQRTWWGPSLDVFNMLHFYSRLTDLL